MKKQNVKKLLIVVAIIILLLIGLFILKNNKKGTMEHLEEELLRFLNGENVTLTCDYDLTGYDWSASKFANIVTVKSGAVLDGAGHTITGLNASRNNYGGLFGYLSCDGTDEITIKNLTLKNVNLKGTNIDGEYAGGALIGWLKTNNATVNIENINIENANIEGYKYIGGIVGYSDLENYSYITNCQVKDSNLNSTYRENVDGVISSKGHVGGIIGFSNGTKFSKSIVSNTKISGSTDAKRAGALIGTAQIPVKIEDNNSISNVTINNNIANESNIIGADDYREDKTGFVEIK